MKNDFNLKDIKIFKGLNGSLLEKINSEKRECQFDKGHLVYHENTPCVGIYCIESGLVKQYKTAEDGKQYIVRLAKDGESLGLDAIFTDNFYDTSVEMVTEGRLWFVSKDLVLECIEKNSELAKATVTILANQLKWANDDRLELAHGSTRERLASVLSILARQHGEKKKDRININLELSREEIADMAGTVTETAVRVLSEFKNENYIESDGKKLSILNLAAIDKMVYLEKKVPGL